MKRIQSADYSIYFQQDGYKKLADFIATNQYSSVFILVDENTLQYCYPHFLKQVSIHKPIKVIEVHSGEAYKNIDACLKVWNTMTELGADRNSLLILLGGGVITDLGGFVAATFKRGIDFINIPTTLLAMVDASVGGKTGVDLGCLKNQIGAFANPKMIVIDPKFLHTLNARETRSGMSEIIKYGLTYDAFLYNDIRDDHHSDITSLIYRSIEIKNDVVLQDPREKNLRKILNFGHTIGHAVESYFLASTDNKTLTHGEAVAIGMVCECYISSKLLGFPFEKAQEVKETIVRIFGKIPIEDKDFKPIVDLLKHDKKNVGSSVRFVLLKSLENFSLNCTADTDVIIDSLHFYNA